MRKRVLALAVPLLLLLTVPAYALEPWSGKTVTNLYLDGTTAICTASCTADHDADKIDAVLTLYQDDSYVDSWNGSGTGRVFISGSCEVESDKSYHLVLTCSMNGAAEQSAAAASSAAAEEEGEGVIAPRAEACPICEDGVIRAKLAAKVAGAKLSRQLTECDCSEGQYDCYEIRREYDQIYQIKCDHCGFIKDCTHKTVIKTELEHNGDKDPRPQKLFI